MKQLNCEHFNECGGCNLLSTPYEVQLSNKYKLVKQCLKEFNINAKVELPVGMFYPYKYRNKLHLAVREIKGKTEIGFFMENTNRIVPVKKCLLFDNWVTTLIEIIKNFIKNFKISSYNKNTHKGTLKYVVARCIENNIMVTMVVTSKNFAGKEWLKTELSKHFNAVSLYFNLNRRTDNAVFDEQGFYCNLGYKKLRSEMLGVKFELSPNSFFQVNTEITKKIYSNIFNLLNLNKNSVVFDLYSGIGITSCLFASTNAKVVSIESVPNAVNDAKTNIKLNGYEGLITPYVGKCEQLINKINLNKILVSNPEISVFVDPPRIGCQVQVLNEILKLKPQKIIYLSCNPSTLARDLKVLTDGGYKINKIIPYDMFPQTSHVETLAYLSL